jgi:uncharacterized protein (TIGR02271 family)
MSTTVVGLFDNFEHAQNAARELESIGVSRRNVAITRGQDGGEYEIYGGDEAQDYAQPRRVKGGVSGFFEKLFGSDVDERDRGLFSEAARRGTTVVTVTADDDEVDRVVSVLDRFDAVDIDQRAAHYTATGYQSYDPSAPVYTAEQRRTELEQFSGDREVALPVIDEQLKVGKRQVQRGGVRVYSRVTERPVEEQVRLREEHVTVERRPADRNVTSAEVNSLRDGEIVLTESAEEAVASKEARVVEEVLVGKKTTERTETVRDTLRRTDVDVEQLGTERVGAEKGGTETTSSTRRTTTTR